MLLLGDLLYHGPRNDLPREYDPKKVAAMLNEHAADILCVRGNCDAEVDQMMLQFPVLAEYAWIQAFGHAIYAVHGHKAGEDNPPQLRKGEVLLCGHTHLPALRQHGQFTYMNPGSTSIPKGGTPHSCMMLTGDGFTWINLETGAEYVPE